MNLAFNDVGGSREPINAGTDRSRCAATLLMAVLIAMSAAVALVELERFDVFRFSVVALSWLITV